jgi:nucleolar protein 56
MADYLLFEGPMGYSLFKVALQGDNVGNRLKEVQEGIGDLARFGKMVQLSSFLPFEYVLGNRVLLLLFAYGKKETTSRP